MKRYDTYKDSGVEWIREIPQHWEAKPLKFLSSINDDVLSEGTPDDYEIEYVDISSVESLKGITKREVYSFGDAPSRARRTVRNGDLIVSTVRTYLKAIARIESPPRNLVVSTGFAVIRPKRMESKYLGHLFFAEHLLGEIISRSTGISYPAINSAEIGRISVPIPPSDEQTAIAAYLDRKTAEIDELIESKRRLLELYDEEKTAIINQAVTRGINPDAPMKDSGIDWLGEVPTHWEVKRLKHVGRIRYGLGQPPKQKPDGLPIIRATNVFRGKIDEKELILVDPDDIPYDRDPILKTNDIIVVRSGAYTGDSAIIPEKFDGAVTGYDMVFRCFDSFVPQLLSFCFLSDYVLKRQLIMHSLRAAQPHLNREELGETVVVIPNDIAEQQSIVRYIQTESHRIDTQKTRTEKLIDLLTEYRTALISEVVTGKVKVV